MHRGARPVPKLEHLLHGLLGLAIFGLAGTAFTAQLGKMFIALGAFFALGLLAEFVYHRDIPAEEHSLHATEHMLLFGFVVLAVVMSSVEGPWTV